MKHNRNHSIKETRDGFTLIEVLVVLFILSILLGTIIFSLNTDAVKHYQSQNFAKKLMTELQLASMEAITRQQLYRLVVHQNQYEFERYDFQRDNEKQIWNPLNQNTILKKSSIPRHISVCIGEISGVYFYPSGEISPFQIEIVDSNRILGRISGDASGHLAMEWMHEK